MGLLLSVVDFLKKVFTWAVKYPRAAFEAVLVAIILLLGIRDSRQKQQLLTMVQKQQGLAANLSEQLTLTKNELEIARRTSSGQVVYKNVYVPPEGTVVISEEEQKAVQKKIDDLTAQLQAAAKSGNTTKENEIQNKIASETQNLNVSVIDHGWTLNPGIGLGYGGEGVKIHGDVKVYFFERYGLLLGGSADGVGPAVSRHLDDLMWGSPRNLEFYLQYRIFKFSSSPISPIEGGLRLGF